MSAAVEEEGRRRGLVRADPHEAIVSPLELFFDLVFVFALTQVTAFLAEDPTFAQLGPRSDRAGDHLVGLVGLLLADEHRRPRARCCRGWSCSRRWP